MCEVQWPVRTVRLRGGSLWRGGSSFTGDPGRYVKIWACLPIGAPIVPKGTWCQGARLVYRGLWKMVEGGPLYWGTLTYVKQCSEMGVFFHRGPTFGEHGWAFLSWGLLIRGIFIRSFRDMLMPCRRVSLSIGAPLGEPGGGSFAGNFERKEVVYLGSILGPRGYSDFKSGGHGCHDPIWGTKGPSIKA